MTELPLRCPAIVASSRLFCHTDGGWTAAHFEPLACVLKLVTSDLCSGSHACNVLPDT